MQTITKPLLFLKQFLKDFKHTGSITPSSRFLTNRMLQPIDFSKPQKILELGPGTGCMTTEILKRMHPDSELTCIEINPAFCQSLKEISTIKQFNVCEASVLDLEDKFKPCEFNYVVSGLPLANFQPLDIEKILNNSKILLSPQGKYIQFQYTLRNDEMIKSAFKKVSKSFSLFNIPPAIVYRCSS